MNDILIVSHFHKAFPFNHESTWIKAAYAGSHAPYGWTVPGPGNWINTSQYASIYKHRHYYSKCTEDEFLRAMGQQASEYYLWKNASADFIGCTTYRRYLNFSVPQSSIVKSIMASTQENANYFSSEDQKNAALKLLETHDAVTNHLTPLPCSVVDQYLQSQPKEYLELFLNGIVELMPDYRNQMDWWNQNQASFETCYVMRKQLFKKYVSELFELLEYVWKNATTAYPVERTTSEPLPWRYPGFLGERFLPFFLHANQVKVARVPLVILD